MGTIPQIGAEYAGYRIDGLLGRGGQGVVYRAENPRLGNLVAIKLLAPELAHDDMFRERFVRESRVAASINHPNIVPIYDFGAHDELLYIVMRYVQGADLKHLIQRRGRLTPQHTVAVMTQAGRALDAAHALGLIHRDVKPANFLIEHSSGEDGADHVYLADFGLTKHSQSRSGLTATGVFVGTIDYVAPEQIAGEDVDARTDIYSMGCVIYECLTGKIPFEKDAEMAVLYAHVHEAPPSPSDLRPELPAAIDSVMRKALAKSPDDRYQSCRELVTAMADALGERPGAAPPTMLLPDEDSKSGAPMPPPPLHQATESAAPAGETVIAGTAAMASETVVAEAATALTPPDRPDPPTLYADRSDSVVDVPGRGRPPDRTPPPPGSGSRRRWPLLIVATVAIVVAAAVALRVFGGGSEHPASTPTPKPPTQLEGAIMDAKANRDPNDGVNGHLGKCSRVGAPVGGATEEWVCASNYFTGVPNTATISQFKTTSAMWYEYRRLLASYRGSPVEYNVRDCKGSKAIATGGETAWTHSSTQPHAPWLAQMMGKSQAQGSGMGMATLAGRVFCGPYGSAGAAWVAASANQADRTLVVVHGSDHGSVWMLWHSLHHHVEFTPM